MKVPHKDVYHGQVKKPYLYLPETWVLYEIHRYQKSTNFLVREAPFQCSVWVIAVDSNIYCTSSHQPFLLSKKQLMLFVHLFEDSNFWAMHGKRVTVIPKDMQLTQWIWGGSVRFEDGISVRSNVRHYAKNVTEWLNHLKCEFIYANITGHSDLFLSLSYPLNITK